MSDADEQGGKVVSLHSRKGGKPGKQRKPRIVPALPEVSGVASFVAVEDVDLIKSLRASCLTDATIDAARITLIPPDKWLSYGFTSRVESGWSAQPNAMLLPFFNPRDGSLIEYRLRSSALFWLPPKRGQQQSKKYDQPPGTPSLVYVPPLAATIEHMQDKSRPLYWTEGEKKALLLAQLGHCVVGLTGVYNWAQPNSKSSSMHEFIGAHYALDREHVIVFDGDARTNPEVKMAARKLAGVLGLLGATCVSLCLPPVGDAKGIDDYAAAAGVEACAQLLASVREPIDPIRSRAEVIELSSIPALNGSGDTAQLRMPRQYEFDAEGVLWRLSDSGDPDDRRLVCSTPIYVARVLKNERGEDQRLELRFVDTDGQWRSHVLPRAEAHDRQLMQLCSVGANLHMRSVASVAEWINEFTFSNRGRIPDVRCADRTGWHDGQFVLTAGHVLAPAGTTPLTVDVREHNRRMFTSLGPRKPPVLLEGVPCPEYEGHLAALQETVSTSSECALVVFAALAAPILDMFDVPNFAVHLCGESSRGKTSMMRCAASIYGDPHSSAWVPSWNTTSAGIEQRAAMLCDLPLCYDEAGVSDEVAVQAAVYMLINGVGRQRSTKELRLRETLTWHTVVISTGERELAPETAATGAQVRVIAVSVDGVGELDGAQVDALVARNAEHAGAFGREWIRLLVELRSDASKLDTFRQRLKEIRTELRVIALSSGNPLNGRISQYFAVLCLAEHMASSIGLGAFEGATMRNVFLARCREATAPEQLVDRLLHVLADWVQEEPTAFPHAIVEFKNERSLPKPIGTGRVHGFIREDGVLCIFPTALSKHLSRNHPELHWTRATQSELAKRGHLARGQNDAGDWDGRYTIRVRVNANRLRVYGFTLTPPRADGGLT